MKKDLKNEGPLVQPERQDWCWRVPVSVSAEARMHRARIKLRTYGAISAAYLSRPQLAIVGCYNTSNVGDLALGWTLRQLVRRQGRRCQLQSFGVVQRFPAPQDVIIGGGSILALKPTGPLTTIEPHYGNSASNAVIVGVSGPLDSDQCSDKMMNFLRTVPYFSVRSKEDRTILSDIIGRDIIVQPDIAFGLAAAFGISLEGDRDHKKPVMGISVCPHIIHRHGRLLRSNPEPSTWFQKHLPAEAAVYDKLGPAYVETVVRVIQSYRDRGWTVRCISFAVEDYLFARSVLKNSGVEFVPYTADPVAVFRHVSSCSALIATRFHAHVFALLAKVPVLSIAYAPKCKHLWQDLDLPAETQVTLLDMVYRPSETYALLTSATPALLPSTQHETIQASAVEACMNAIGSI